MSCVILHSWVEGRRGEWPRWQRCKMLSCPRDRKNCLWTGGIDVKCLHWLFRLALRAQDQLITLCADNEPARMAQGVSSMLYSHCTGPHKARDSWRARRLPGRPKQTLPRQAVRGSWSVPHFLLLQMVAILSNGDVATEVLPRDSPLLLGSCSWDLQCFPKGFCPVQPVLCSIWEDLLGALCLGAGSGQHRMLLREKMASQPSKCGILSLRGLLWQGCSSFPWKEEGNSRFYSCLRPEG